MSAITVRIREKRNTKSTLFFFLARDTFRRIYFVFLSLCNGWACSGNDKKYDIQKMYWQQLTDFLHKTILYTSILTV